MQKMLPGEGNKEMSGGGGKGGEIQRERVSVPTVAGFELGGKGL